MIAQTRPRWKLEIDFIGISCYYEYAGGRKAANSSRSSGC